MLVSLKWLKRYMDLPYTPAQISEMLTTIGLEVEGFEEKESIPGGLKGLVVGEVIECERHPNADKLSLTKVYIGADEPLQIVCGAPNVAKGQKVIVATVGTKLYPTSGEPFIIKKGKIRGEESHGMICAEDEIGIGTSHDGIVILPAETEVGQDIASLYNMESDIIFEIGLTPNRSDATSQLGVAKDLLAYIRVHHDQKTSLRHPERHSVAVQTSLDEASPIAFVDTAGCPRYAGLIIEGIKVADSPQWLKQSLQAIGVKSINNVVDITNFILHEMGQPLHAFDLDKVKGGKIKVQSLATKTEFIALDGQKIELRETDLMICDAHDHPMCMAGVYGGLESGVSAETTRIFLESAHFDAGTIRKSSMKHNLRTDAAKVFEKGSDPNIVVSALERAAYLFQEIMGAHVVGPIFDLYPNPVQPRKISLTYQMVNDTLGANLTNAEILQILHALQMEVRSLDDHTVEVSVPTDKADVTRPIDLVEEILRIYGFNKIEIPQQVRSNLSFSPSPNKAQVKNTLADLLVSRGYFEMMGLSLIESKYYDQSKQYPDEVLVRINNTSNVHLDVMRPEMMNSGLLSVVHNLNRQQTQVKLFEFGKTYQKSGDDYREDSFLTIFACGKSSEDHWLVSDGKDLDYFDIKRQVVTIFERLGLNDLVVSEITDDERFAYGLRYDRGHQYFGKVGAVSPLFLKKMGIKTNVFFAEISLETVFASQKNSKIIAEELSKFPSIRRDLALVIDEQVHFNQLAQIAKSTDKKYLKQVGLFDVYKNEKALGSGKKSYALSFVFENRERTFTDQDIDAVMGKLIQNFEKEVNANIRK